MAIQIQFDGFVHEVKVLAWGTVAVVTHANRAKNDAGQWETVSKDYIDVTVPEGVTVREGDLVRVGGTAKLGAYLKKDGTPVGQLKVRAQVIEPVPPREARGVGSVPSSEAWGNPAPTLIEDAPF